MQESKTSEGGWRHARGWPLNGDNLQHCGKGVGSGRSLQNERTAAMRTKQSFNDQSTLSTAAQSK